MNATTQQTLQLYIPSLAPLATLAVVLVGFLYNNSRLNDFGARLIDTRDLLRAEFNGQIGTLRAETREQIGALRAETVERFTRLDAKIDNLEAKMDRQHDTVMRMLADHEQRLNKLEEGG